MKRLVPVLLIALSLTQVQAAQEQQIKIQNHTDNQTLPYPVILLKGDLQDHAEQSITVTNTTSTRETREMIGLAHNGHFKALAELIPGENKLVLKAGKSECTLTVSYKPQSNPYIVRAIYLTDKTGETKFETPLENDPQDFAGKFDTAMKLMQTFTAERMNDLGFGLRTFNLELDEKGKVIVHIFKEPESAETYYALNDQVWWGRVYKEMEKEYPVDMAKNLAIAAYTRFDPKTHKAKGHTALGGGGLGLFGSGDFFTWPNRLQDAQTAFMNTTPIDGKKIMDDSNGRSNFWGAFSTTIGACLHETGHTFGLPHTREPMDIMTRGFDQFNRAFVVQEAPSAANPKPLEFKENEIAAFSPISAAALAPSRWFTLEKQTYGENGKVTIKIDAEGKELSIQANRPIRYIGIGVKGEAVQFVVPTTGQEKQWTKPLADLRAEIKSEEFDVRVIDDQGDITMHSVKKAAK